MTRLKLFPRRQPLSQPTINYRNSILPFSQKQYPTLPNYSSVNTNQHDNITTQHDNSVDHTFVNGATDTPIKIYSKTNCPFPYYFSKTEIILLPKLI